MNYYFVKRLLWTLFVLWGISVITFGATFLSPIDPARTYAGLRAEPEVVEQIRREWGLDQPLPVQYLRYVGRILQGDLGRSYYNGTPVLDVILQRLPATAQLALAGALIELVIGMVVGIIAAVNQQTWIDRTAMIFSLLGIVTPPFVLGLIALYYLAFRWSIFPLAGYGGLRHLALPALVLGLAGGAWYARVLRSTMLEIMNQDFVRTARAKGLKESAVIIAHILRNALGPVIIMFGMDIGVFFSGVLVVERVFAWPGIGFQTWQSIGYNDIPLIMGLVLLSAFFVAIMNLLADFANGLLDPRIRYS